MIDYIRNWGINQEKIRGGRITIIGASPLANYLCFYIAGLGLRNIRIIDDALYSGNPNEFLVKKGYKVKSLEEHIKSINDDLYIEAVPLKADKALIGSPDILIDLTNNPGIKNLSQRAFSLNPQIKFYISASSSEDSCSMIVREDKSKLVSKINPLKNFNCLQGNYSSGLMAAIILDEIRKIISPLDSDKVTLGKINYNLECPKRFFLGKNNPCRLDSPKGKILLCGAGGIGTYAALNLTLEGFDIDIFDGDIIEPHNISRQLFYHDFIGKKKAGTLRYKLKKITKKTKILALDNFLTPENIPSVPYDAMICCADNWQARKTLNDYAIESGIPLFNAAVTPFSAKAEAYLPNKNYCLNCRYDLDNLVKRDGRQSCADYYETNVVMTNAFIGAFLAGEVKALLNPDLTTSLKNNFLYQSKPANLSKFIFSSKERRIKKCRCSI